MRCSLQLVGLFARLSLKRAEKNDWEPVGGFRLGLGFLKSAVVGSILATE